MRLDDIIYYCMSVKRRCGLIFKTCVMSREELCFRNSSFSQLGEDRMIAFYLKYWKHLESISYVDIGANHPFDLSNTVLLDELFQIKKAILVEPNYDLYLKLKKRRKGICENIGITGTEDGASELTFYVMDANTLNTFKLEEVRENEKRGYKLLEKRKVPVMNINALLKKYFKDGNIDVLSIDVEGMDDEIVKAIDYTKYQPLVICVETSHTDRESMNAFMETKGYQVFGVTCENTIYIKVGGVMDGRLIIIFEIFNDILGKYLKEIRLEVAS